jgi:hypothetical protein
LQVEVVGGSGEVLKFLLEVMMVARFCKGVIRIVRLIKDYIIYHFLEII